MLEVFLIFGLIFLTFVVTVSVGVAVAIPLVRLLEWGSVVLPATWQVIKIERARRRFDSELHDIVEAGRSQLRG